MEPVGVGRVLHLAGQGLAKVLGVELVLKGGEGPPPSGVALFRLVGLDRGLELIVPQVPPEFRRGVGLTGFAVKRLHLKAN